MPVARRINTGRIHLYKEDLPSLVILIIDLVREELLHIVGSRTAETGSEKSAVIHGKSYRTLAGAVFIRRLFRPQIAGKIIFPGEIIKGAVLSCGDIPF